jgi:aspartate/methionine/tyrosine aminotransferase
MELFEELNTIIKTESETTFCLLSKKGKNIFFPKKGILGQSADAKGKKINATIGIANEDDGIPMHLSGISDKVLIEPKRAFPYAPSYGDLELRKKWKELMLIKNPSLKNEISLPVVSCALTHGLFISSYLFLDEGNEIILPDYYWDNYKLIFENSFNARTVTFQTFIEGEFNVSGLKEKIMQSRKPIVLLNFPNNPTGYTPSKSCVKKLIEMFNECSKDRKILVICDDAYFGLVYKDEIFEESIFSLLSDLSENLLCIKLDGATKEDYVWGFRVGFITYGIKSGTKELYLALEDKTAGAIRANISNVSLLSQSLIYDGFMHPNYEKEKKQKFNTLKERFLEVERVLIENKNKFEKHFAPLPYNSGYFMCIKLNYLDGESVRKKLLEKYDTGIIAFGNVIRIAFSGIAKSKIKLLFENIYNACEELKGD